MPTPFLPHGLRLVLLAGVLLLLSLTGTSGQEAPDEDRAGVVPGWKELVCGPEPEPDALAAAKERLAPLSARQLAVLDCMRFLLRPDWTREVFPHVELDRHLRPFTDTGEGPLTLNELHRLWALLQVGYGDEAQLGAAVARLQATPVESRLRRLDQVLVLMLTARAALHRGLGDKQELTALIADAWETANVMTSREGARRTRGMRTTCMLTTVLLWRIALEQKLEVAADFMDQDLESFAWALEKYPPPESDSSRAGAPGRLSNMVALSLVAEAKGVGNKARKLVHKHDDLIRANVAASIGHLRQDQGYRSADGVYFTTLAPFFRPADFKKTSDWQKWVSANIRYWSASNGAMLPQSSRGLHAASSAATDRGQSVWTEPYAYDYLPRVEGTALTLIGMSGGLLPPKPKRRSEPTIEWTPAELDGLMRARALVAAHEHNKLTRGLREWIPEAIRRGCEQLVEAQASDGSISTRGNTYHVGYTATAGLALLHGGYDRKGPAVSGVLRFLESKSRDDMVRPNYEAACVLMFLQRYYLPEQSAALAADTPAERRAARKAVWEGLPERHRAWITKLAVIVETSQCGRGGAWSYLPRRDSEGWEENDDPVTGRPGQPNGADDDRATGSESGRAEEGEAGTPDDEAEPGASGDDAVEEPEYPSAGDHSNTQYAWLGMWCAAMLGREFDPLLLRNEFHRLESTFKASPTDAPVPMELPTPESESRPDRATSSERDDVELVPVGGWSYFPRDPRYPPERAMTAAMLGNVKIVLDEMEVLECATAESRATAKRLTAGAMGLLSRYLVDHALSMDRPPRTPSEIYFVEGPGANGATDLYCLYTIERACVLNEVRVLYGNEDWYRSGALFLQHTLPETGPWPCSPLDNAWIVLFLKRALPTSPPSPPPGPRGPTTGSGESKRD